MTTILKRIDSKYQSSKSKPGSRVGSGKSSSGSTPKTTSLQTGVVKQAAQKLEAFVAQKTEIDQLKETLEKMEAEKKQINDDIKAKKQKAEEKSLFNISVKKPSG